MPIATRALRTRLAAVAAAAAAVVALAACGGSDDEQSTNGAGGSLTLGMNNKSLLSQAATYVAIEEGYYAEEGIDDVDVVTTDDQIRRLRDGEIDITQGDTDALLAAASEGPAVEEEEEDVLLLAGHRAKDNGLIDIPVESIATTADFLDGHVDLVHDHLGAQLKAREFIHDEANRDAVLEIMRANGFEVTPESEATWDREHVQISEDGGFSIQGMDELVSEAQSRGQLPAKFRWHEHFNLEALLYTQEEAGRAHNPPENKLPPG